MQSRGMSSTKQGELEGRGDVERARVTDATGLVVERGCPFEGSSIVSERG